MLHGSGLPVQRGGCARARSVSPFVNLLEEDFKLLDAVLRLIVVSAHPLTGLARLVALSHAELHLQGHAKAIQVDA